MKDLLWACPSCHAIESIDLSGRCARCRARFRRGRGARIRFEREGAIAEELDARAWLARLPWPEIDAEGSALPTGLRPPFQATVSLRRAVDERALRSAGDYLGRAEIMGPPETGVLRLDEQSLAFSAESGGGWERPLTALAAIQPASSAIQLRLRAETVISARFRTGSVRLWEQRLKYCVRLAWRAAGRGEIVEFQPSIRSR
ncbi:MAG TPA: hypothetical protein VK939_10840 [Longimicrobiales bacterium]|nr:hypothetical protein [Longimicrobiales bacterium]